MIYRLVLSALFLGVLAGCETTGATDSRWHHQYQEYLTLPHFRAFASTSGAGRLAASIGWSFKQRSVEGAIERALAGCKTGQKKYSKISECRLFALGNIEVAGLSEEQLDKAISFYRNNLNATKEDLATGSAPLTVPTFDLLISDEKRFVGTKVRPGSETNSITMDEGNIAFFFVKAANITPGDFHTWQWKFYAPTEEMISGFIKSGGMISGSRWNYWETLHLTSPRIQPGLWKVEFEFDERVVVERTFEILAP
jgi:hypothetical protein